MEPKKKGRMRSPPHSPKLLVAQNPISAGFGGRHSAHYRTAEIIAARSVPREDSAEQLDNSVGGDRAILVAYAIMEPDYVAPAKFANGHPTKSRIDKPFQFASLRAG
jgi:hypothetical protein